MIPARESLVMGLVFVAGGMSAYAIIRCVTYLWRD